MRVLTQGMTCLHTPDFYFVYKKECHWLDWNDDLTRMFTNLPDEQLIVTSVVELKEESALMKSVRSLRKLQASNNL